MIIWISIHAKNPNQDNFPVNVEKHNGEIVISRQLKDFVKSIDYEWFYHEWDIDGGLVKTIYIYDKNVGLSIEN